MAFSPLTQSIDHLLFLSVAELPLHFILWSRFFVILTILHAARNTLPHIRRVTWFLGLNTFEKLAYESVAWFVLATIGVSTRLRLLILKI